MDINKTIVIVIVLGVNRHYPNVLFQMEIHKHRFDIKLCSSFQNASLVDFA